MKTVFFLLLMVLTVTGYGQLKVTQPIIYYKSAGFTVSPLIPVATTNTGAVPLKQMRDSIAAAIAGVESGSMVYPGSGIPLSAGTAWGTSISNNSVNWNTAYSWGNHAGLYTALAHTGATGSAHGNSTSSVSGFMSASDKTKLDGVASGATANAGTVTSVATGLGLTGGTITSSGTLALDTANASVLSRQRALHEYSPKVLFTYLSGNITTTSTTLTNAPGLSLSLAASSVYEIEFNLTCTISTTANVGFGINLSDATGALISGTLYGPSSIAGYTGAISKTLYAVNTAISGYYSLVTVIGGTIFKGVVITGPIAPTLQVQYVISAGTLTVYQLSYVKALKVL